MNKHTIAVFVFWSLWRVLVQPVNAQTWQQIQTFGSKENDLLSNIACNGQLSCFASTAFRGQLVLDGKVLNSMGGEDVLLLRRDHTGKYRYFAHGGSVQDDEVSAQLPLPNGGLICVGSYWSQLILEDPVLVTKNGGKALFLAKYNAGGQLEWTTNIEGSGIKYATDLALTPDGNFYLSGYFNDTLAIADQKRFTAALSAAFLMKFSNTGKLQWIKILGSSGNTRATALALLPQARISMTGSFDETIQFQDTTFTANTHDQDVFVACWDENGKEQWSRKAGGVYDATPISMESDTRGNLFIGGNIVGVLRFGNNINIQSRDGNADVFIAQYSSNGVPLRAKVIGGELVQQITQLSVSGGRIYLSGYFQGSLNFDQLSITSGNQFQGFIAALDTLEKGQWLQMLTASESIYPYGLAAIGFDSLLVGGSYQGSAKLGRYNLPPANSYDLFLGALFPTATAVQEKKQSIERFYLYPNPVKDVLRIEAPGGQDFDIRVYDQWGRLMVQQKNIPALLVGGWPVGVYWAQLSSKNRAEWQRFIVIPN